MDPLYQVNVSSLEVRSDPLEPSKVFLKRSQVIKLTGRSIRYKNKEWVKVITISKPIISGYVPKRFLQKI